MQSVIVEIQSLGIRVPSIIHGRKGGAGPADGCSFLLNGIAVNAPVHAPYVPNSPYTLQPLGDHFLLLKDGKELVPIEVVPEPRFYQFSTEDGVCYKKIALLHGKDCLASTVIQSCSHWKTSRRCAFCGTGISLENNRTIARKTPGQLAEVAAAAQRLDGISHIVLTSGTGDPPGTEIPYLARCANAVRTATGMPIHVQCAPPDDPALLDELKEAGADTVGIHIESFDQDTLARVAPAKAAMGTEHYEKAWKRAVALFGPGQVSSFLIVGMGEAPASVAWGSEVLADLGVYPFVVPLRPIPGSRMQDALPPDPEIMKRIYASVAKILQRKGLSAKDCLAGCVRCGACSALYMYEKKSSRRVCHTIRNDLEMAGAYAIRNEIFVREQGLFRDSDADGHDEHAIHLILKDYGEIVGTVRVFPDKADSCHWIGSRLAVRKMSRDFRSGSLLVREAMRRVKKKGCTVFTAHVQEKNVPFFKKIGWNPIGPPEDCFGHPHQLMQADLNRVPEDF